MVETGFSEINMERVRYTGDGFWYGEIALTGRCNFACTYCNRFSAVVDNELIRSFINQYKDTLRHVQLTGGEPTEYPHLSEICSLIKRSGVKLGISTNGSAPRDLYYALNADMFSISLDDYDIDILEQRGYRKVERVIINVKTLAQTIYVNVGLVIDRLNVDRINDIIHWILDLGVADIKLSVSTKDPVVPKFDNTDYGNYPILNYRVNRFRQGLSMRGMQPTDDFKCGLVTNDISIVGDNHYPCLVYAREGGRPIGSLRGDVAVDRATWYAQHEPKEDPICREYCMDFKCEFNRAKASYKGGAVWTC